MSSEPLPVESDSYCRKSSLTSLFTLFFPPSLFCWRDSVWRLSGDFFRISRIIIRRRSSALWTWSLTSNMDNRKTPLAGFDEQETVSFPDKVWCKISSVQIHKRWPRQSFHLQTVLSHTSFFSPFVSQVGRPRCVSRRCASCRASCRSSTSRASSWPPSTRSSTPVVQSPTAPSTSSTGPYWCDSTTGKRPLNTVCDAFVMEARVKALVRTRPRLMENVHLRFLQTVQPLKVDDSDRLCSSEKYAEVLVKYFHYVVCSRKIKAVLSYNRGASG